MRVLVHSSAESDLDRIADWIAKDNPRAAARMVSKLYERISFLETDELAYGTARVGRGHARACRIALHHRLSSRRGAKRAGRAINRTWCAKKNRRLTNSHEILAFLPHLGQTRDDAAPALRAAVARAAIVRRARLRSFVLRRASFSSRRELDVGAVALCGRRRGAHQAAAHRDDGLHRAALSSAAARR